MLLALALAWSLVIPQPTPTAPDSTEVLYVHLEVDALRDWCSGAASEADSLRCRYRLYPLTWDEEFLEDLPREPQNATAESLALLSGLWGYRASQHGFPSSIRFGLRSQKLLDRALEMDPDSPYVLLVEGQALLFKPKFVGGDPAEAAERFRLLQERLEAMPDPPLVLMEARTWHWYALAVAGDDRAEPLRKALMEENPAPLFASMLQNPP